MLDLSGLNKDQLEAVLHEEGPYCVIAGAGSGKTRVLTYRIAKLIEKKVQARNILAITFTNKAYKEMKERAGTLIGALANEVAFGTIHSVCYSILKGVWGVRSQKELLMGSDQTAFVRKILGLPNEANPYGMNWDVDIKLVLGYVSWQKNCLITPENAIHEDYKYVKFYNLYEQLKEEANMLDYDDMLVWTWDLLTVDSKLLHYYQERFKYILVDEFQDTNLVQYKIIQMIGKHKNVFVVGDARQAIYGWRAADVNYILNFKRDWNAKEIMLRTNYRSSANIVEFSNVLIRNSTIDYHGECVGHKGPSYDPFFMICDDKDHEAREIVNEIKSSHLSYKDTAILYRTNAQSRALEDACIAMKIPYIIYGDVSFYARKEVKDIVAYLKVVYDTGDAEAIKRVINVPPRYLGKVFMAEVGAYAMARKITLFEAIETCHDANKWKYKKSKEFIKHIYKLQVASNRMRIGNLIREIREITNYDEYLRNMDGNGDQYTPDGADNSRIDNLNALVESADRFNDLGEFIAYAEQAASMSKKDDDDINRVKLMTLHKCKGLEFPVVFLAGLVHELLPHRYSCESLKDLEEERRLCYVGVTRAEERLYMSSFDPENVSMFMQELMDYSNRKM